MRACSYVGRVGGLAVALGVGAAVFGGTAVAVADDAGRGDAPAGAHSTAQTGAARSGGSLRGDAVGTPPAVGVARAGAGQEPRGASESDLAATDSGVGRGGETVGDAGGRGGGGTVAPPAAATTQLDATPVADTEAADTAPASEAIPSAPATEVPPVSPDIVENGPVADVLMEPAAEPVAAPPSAPMASLLTVAPDRLGDPIVDGNPVSPADSALDWTVLAFTRRNAPGAAGVRAQPAAAEPTLPLIMGPSGVPIPSPAYGEAAMNYYITPSSPDGTLPQQLIFTPEGLYPITGVKSLPLNTSDDQGVRIIYDTLAKLPAGTTATVFGYSQSAIISSLLQGGYTIPVGGKDELFSVPSDLNVSFVLVGNEMNPDGGLLSRYSGRDMPMLSLPSLGIDFYGATPGGLLPPDGGPIQTYYPTTTYIREYDGFSDSPRYPINFLADLNAGLGIVYVHVQYTPTISQEACAQKPFCLLQSQVEAARASGPLPSSQPTQTYYFIPTENLPLLQPLRELPFIGEPVADLLQPSLKVLVDLGYGDVQHGFTETGLNPNANELGPFEVLPSAAVFGEAFGQFCAGIKQGIEDFIADFGPDGSLAREIAAFTWPTPPSMAAAGSGDFIQTVQTAITSVSNAISGDAASLYAALLPTADIVNALLVTLPAYSANLFLYGMQEVFDGQVLDGLVDAVGLPLAATVGLSTTAGLVGALVWGDAIVGAV